VKYIAIIYGNREMWQSFPPEDAARAICEVDAFNRRHAESGELLGAYGLGDELTAWTCPFGHGQIHTSFQAGGTASASMRRRTSGSVTSRPSAQL
jgi:hypothetical protein